MVTPSAPHFPPAAGLLAVGPWKAIARNATDASPSTRLNVPKVPTTSISVDMDSIELLLSMGHSLCGIGLHWSSLDCENRYLFMSAPSFTFRSYFRLARPCWLISLHKE